MRYFGVPTCPYCKKRVNLIRTWSLKRQGEYKCPRCSGISNIFLSPLIYVLGLMAIFTSGSLYFFHKFVLDDIDLETALYVFIPFGIFFLFSIFMVYLERPVIRKISREEYEKKRKFRSAADNTIPLSQPDEKEYYDPEDYTPRGVHVPGPTLSNDAGLNETGVVNQAAFRRARQQAAMENVQVSQRVAVSGYSTQNSKTAIPPKNLQVPPITNAAPKVTNGKVPAKQQNIQLEPVPRRQAIQPIGKQQIKPYTSNNGQRISQPQQRTSFAQQGYAMQNNLHRSVASSTNKASALNNVGHPMLSSSGDVVNRGNRSSNSFSTQGKQNGNNDQRPKH